MEPKIGGRLKHYRILHGMSMREVAEHAGITEGYVSKVENDKVRPSLATLHRIAVALKTNISELFSNPDNSGQLVWVIKSEERPMMKFGGPRNGDGVHLERISPVYPGFLLQANVHVVQPGGGSDECISHVGQEVGMVLEGCLELFVNDEVHKLSAGDAFAFDSQHDHRYRNPGKEVTKVVWVNSPPTF